MKFYSMNPAVAEVGALKTIVERQAKGEPTIQQYDFVLFRSTYGVYRAYVLSVNYHTERARILMEDTVLNQDRELPVDLNRLTLVEPNCYLRDLAIAQAMDAEAAQAA